MTEREIKLELSKASFYCGISLENVKKFFEWIMETPDEPVPEGKPTKWDNTPIEELARRTHIAGTITKRCKDNGINTVGDLIRCGCFKFQTFKNVGAQTVNKINIALEAYYDFPNWYTT